jgi:hypothetical protein
MAHEERCQRSDSCVMPMEREKICLGCSLPICDEKSKECRFVQITRKDRSAYDANYYAEHKEKRKSQTSNYQKRNQTWLRRDRSQYFKDRYRRKCDEVRNGGRNGDL